MNGKISDTVWMVDGLEKNTGTTTRLVVQVYITTILPTNAPNQLLLQVLLLILLLEVVSNDTHIIILRHSSPQSNTIQPNPNKIKKSVFKFQ